jgi:hypothetical protein
MYFSFIHQIISIIFFGQLVQGENNYSQSNNVNHLLSTMINDKDKERQNSGIKHIDENDENNEQQDLDNIGWPMAYNRKFLVANEEQMLLLPIMIRMLLERLQAQPADTTSDLQKFSEVRTKYFCFSMKLS